jgi:hypothetical protein
MRLSCLLKVDPHTQLGSCFEVRPLLVSDYLLEIEMGSTMAAADKEFSSAFLALAATLGLLVGLI